MSTESPRASEVLTISDQGVVFLGSDDSTDRVFLSIPAPLLVALFQAYSADDTPSATAEAVATLFDGQQGDLDFLTVIGCHE